jgi:hypothetical protein
MTIAFCHPVGYPFACARQPQHAQVNLQANQSLHGVPLSRQRPLQVVVGQVPAGGQGTHEHTAAIRRSSDFWKLARHDLAPTHAVRSLL